MADLQDILKEIEEERKKAAEEELKQRQNVKEQQKKDAKILSDAQKGLVKEKIEQQKKERQKQEELRNAQENFNAEVNIMQFPKSKYLKFIISPF